MKVYLSQPEGTPARDERGDFERLLASDRLGRYQLAADYESADIALIVSPWVWEDRRKFDALERHPLIAGAKENAFVYIEDDDARCVYQGLYCGMPRRWFNSDRQRATPFRIIWNPFVLEMANAPDAGRTEFLFSFTGQKNHPVRDRLFEVGHPRSLVEDSTPLNIYGSKDRDAIARAQRRYAEQIRASKFVLCPRGAGTSSFRLYETMALGRVPVILGDEWMPPAGPAWETFSIRSPECDAGRVGAVLEEHEARWPTMARAAREAYLNWFAPDILFHRMMEACADIAKRKRLPESVWQRLPSRQAAYRRARGWCGRLRRLVTPASQVA